MDGYEKQIAINRFNFMLFVSFSNYVGNISGFYISVTSNSVVIEVGIFHIKI